jgi:hypothetical protein
MTTETINPMDTAEDKEATLRFHVRGLGIALMQIERECTDDETEDLLATVRHHQRGIEENTVGPREFAAMTNDGAVLYEGDSYDCVYCNAEVPAILYNIMPDADDDAGWAELADAHSEIGCSWVKTRAYQID